ncbi:MAG: hypothetical protein LBI58_06295 [Tannerellaceae bacterium]|jgi:hypothetical protein|nr:hypothetical protein [Tannerellaceae bacterium]
MSIGRWLPRARVALHTLIKGVKSFIDVNAERLAMDKTTRLGDWYKLVFCAAFDPYDADYLLWEDPDTRTFMGTEKLKASEKIIIPLFRELYSLLKGNPLVKDADLKAMNLPERSSNEHHPAPVATEAPAFDVVPLSSNRLRISFYVEDSENRRGKPKGQHGAEIRWGFTDEVKVNPNHLSETSFDTASPFILTFEVEDIGKRIGIALRWANTKSEKGPWSDVAFTYVP